MDFTKRERDGFGIGMDFTKRERDGFGTLISSLCHAGDLMKIHM
jgi:hypothetical protein